MSMQLKEFQMAYRDQGVGTPVLLIHGYPLNSQMWQPQIEGLADCARLIAPDLRGHGDSEPTDGVYTMELHARDCYELLEKLAIHEKVILCGLSMGGYIALAFYRIFPSRVAGMVLSSTRAVADSPEAKINRDNSIRIAQEQGLRPIAEAMAKRLLSTQTIASKPQLAIDLMELMLNNSIQAVVGDLQGMKERLDSLPILASIGVPVQIIHGLEDELVPLEEAAQMQALIPGALLSTVPDAAHLPNMEQPERFNDDLRSFLKQWKS